MGQDTEVELAFVNFLAKYEITYASKAEYPVRFENFRNTYYMVKEHNANPDRTYDLGINQFADKHISEYNFGAKPFASDIAPAGDVFTATTLPPSSVNWYNNTNFVSPPANQGQCGCCWAFSTASTLESALAIQNNRNIKTSATYTISQQNIVDCDTMDSGCNGGWMGNAYSYINSKGGIYSVSGYAHQFTASQGICQTTGNVASSFIPAKIKSYTLYGLSSTHLQYLVALQPIGLGINVVCNQFFYYTGGIITDSTYTCSRKDAKTVNDYNTPINHAVTLIGYNVNTSTPGCSGYWIFKNSWGTSWGEKGFFRFCMTSDTAYPWGLYNMLSWIAVADVGNAGVSALATSWT